MDSLISSVVARVGYRGDLRAITLHERSGLELTTDVPIDNNGKGEAI